MKIFWQENCPNCPPAKELGKQLEEMGIKVKYYNTKDPDGLAEATMFGIMNTPAVTIAEGDNEIKSWKGEVPSLDEVKENLER